MKGLGAGGRGAGGRGGRRARFGSYVLRAQWVCKLLIEATIDFYIRLLHVLGVPYLRLSQEMAG